MGDVRFEQALARIQQADDRAGAIRRLDVEDVVRALGALGREADAFLANVLATEILNRARRAIAVLEHLVEGVVGLDGEGRVTFVNPAACRLLGWRRDELLGRHFHETVQHHRCDGGAAAWDDCPLALLLRGDASSLRERDEDVFLRRDGTAFLAGFSAAPVVSEGVVTGAAVVFSDITSQKQHEARLRLFESAVDVVGEPILWADQEGRLLYANRAAARHAGRRREELVGRTVFELDADATPAAWAAHWTRVKRAGFARVHGHHRAPDGRRVPVDLTATHVAARGCEFQVMVIHVPEDASA